MKIDTKEDAVLMLNYLNREGVVAVESRHGMIEYSVKTPDAKGISDISNDTFVRTARQALAVLLDKPIGGFEVGGDELSWMTKLKRDDAKQLLDAGVQIPDQRLATLISQKSGGMARGVAGNTSAE
jgi:hypothetical protein